MTVNKRYLGIVFLFTLMVPRVWAEVSIDSEKLLSDSTSSLLLLQIEEKKEAIESELDSLEAEMTETSAALEDLDSKIFDVEAFLEDLEDGIEQTEEDIEDTKKEIEVTKVDIKNLGEEIDELLEDQEALKNAISDLIGLLYVKQDTYYDEGDMNLVKGLLSSDSISEIQDEMLVTKEIETQIEEKVNELEDLEKDLEEKKDDLEKKQDELIVQQDQLEIEKESLENQKEMQAQLLEDLETDKDAVQATFQSQMDEYKTLENQGSLYASSTEKILSGISGISELTPEEKAILDSLEASIGSVEGFDQAAYYAQMNWGLPLHEIDWVSAYYHDPDYPYGIHWAVDLPAPQATSLLAVDYGIVTQIHYDGTSAYAYIQIQNTNDFSTLYGHVYLPLVEIGDLVKPGQVIGLSGATPGMTGSGPWTNGPHLHFEVFYQGEHVDPLIVMPLALIPYGVVPSQYQALQDQQIELMALQEELNDTSNETEEVIDR